jgi:hypothetical protein
MSMDMTKKGGKKAVKRVTSDNSVAHLLVPSKKAKDKAAKEEEEAYAHMDIHSSRIHKKALVTGIKTTLDTQVNTASLERGTSFFDVKGISFQYHGLTALVDDAFTDFLCDVLCELGQKTFARAVLLRGNPADKGRSHSRVLPVFVLNLSADQPVPESAESLTLTKLGSPKVKDAFDLPQALSGDEAAAGAAGGAPGSCSGASVGVGVGAGAGAGAGADADAGKPIPPAHAAIARDPPLPAPRAHPSAAVFVSLGVQHGSLLDTVVSGRRITTRSVVKWTFQILNTLHYWHLRFITLGDLTAEDVLLCSDKSVLQSLQHVIPELKRASRSGSGSRGGAKRPSSEASTATDATENSLTPEELMEQEEQRRLESEAGRREVMEQGRKYKAERDAWLHPKWWLRQFEYKQAEKRLEKARADASQGGERRTLTPSKVIRPDEHMSTLAIADPADQSGSPQHARPGTGDGGGRAKQRHKRRYAHSHESALRKYDNSMAGRDTGQCIYKTKDTGKFSEMLLDQV